MTSTLSAVFYGVEIPETLLASEMQNHQADSLKKARRLAGRALAAKALLLERGRALDLQPHQETNEVGQQETYEEALIREVLSEEIQIDPVDPKIVRKIYDDQPDGFSTPPLLEASHILIAPREDSPKDWVAAQAQAEELLLLLRKNPGKFFSFARTVSGCPSAKDGGTLGQIGPGDVLETIWTSLLEVEPGHCAASPVRTKYGWHILRLDHRVSGRRLPFEHVQAHIEAQLEAQAWTVAAAKYVDTLLQGNSAQVPRLAMSSYGGIEDTKSNEGGIDKVLGDILAHPSQALERLDETGLAQIRKIAQEQGRRPEDIIADMIPGFINRANDEAWTQLISSLRDSQTPMEACLSVIVQHQFPKPAPSGRVLEISHRNRKPAQEGKCHDNCC